MCAPWDRKRCLSPSIGSLMVFDESRNVLPGLANGRSLVRRTFHDQGLFKLEAVVLFSHLLLATRFPIGGLFSH